MDRKQIKQEAKEIVKNNKWNIWKPLLITYLIMLTISVVVEAFSWFLGIRLTTIDGAYTGIGFIVEFLISLVSTVLGIGCINYLIKFVRNGDTNTDNMFNCLGKLWLSAIILEILVSIFTTLWMLLFIIPGIIAAISYSMVHYLLIDNEDSSPMDIIKKSKFLMKGYKWDAFVFGLSFMGWILLSILTFGILFIWVVPYMQISLLLYYEKLKEIKNKEVTNV